jgi:hypothetical protein
MMAQNTTSRWIQIGRKKYINEFGDTLVLIDGDTAIINDIRVRGHDIIRDKIKRLGRI